MKIEEIKIVRPSKNQNFTEFLTDFMRHYQSVNSDECILFFRGWSFHVFFPFGMPTWNEIEMSYKRYCLH